MRSASFAAFTLALLLPMTAGAQYFGDVGIDTDGNAFSLSATPQYPAPYSEAVISFISGETNLDEAILTLSVDGKETYKGTPHALPVKLGGAGSVTVVKAVLTSRGATYTKSISIQPQDVMIIAEPIASIPPLYPGGPSVPFDGAVRLVAVANLRDSKGNTSSPSGYSYTWRVDGTRQSSSGVGRSSITTLSPLQYRDREVSVDITSSNGTLVGGTSLTLTSSEPSVRIYENDPLLGIRYDRALSGSYTIRGAESTLYAAPFSFPTSSGTPLVQWFLNGSLAQTGKLITLRPAGSGEGSASLSASVSSNGSSASQTFSILFGQEKSTNLFGL